VSSIGALIRLLFLLALATAAGSVGMAAAAEGSAARPNIVLIVLDTARGDRVSWKPGGRLTTPQLATLAQESVIFPQAHSTAPWTLPSHGSIFTGQLPGRHGASWRAFAKPEDASLEELLHRPFHFAKPERLLPARLKAHGYSTVGWSSNAWISRRTGFDHGFDTFYEMWKQSDRYRDEFGWLPPKVRWKLPVPISTISEMEIGDAGKVLRSFDAHVAVHGLHEPFFLFFNFIDPHYPYSPPRSWRYAFSSDRELAERIGHFEFDELAMGAGARPVDVRRFAPFYDAELLYVDAAVGRLVTRLRERGLFDNTLIVVVGDHGENLGENGHFSHQFSMDEEVLHIPLLLKFPHSARAGTVVDDPRASNLDVYATVLAAAGIAPGQNGEEAEAASRDLSHGDTAQRKLLISEYHYGRPFLEVSQHLYPGFDIKTHAVDRYVVYDASTRYEFQLPPGGVLEDVGAGAKPSSGRAAARAAVDAYLSSRGADSSVVHGAPEADPETLQRLRSLGYVD